MARTGLAAARDIDFDTMLALLRDRGRDGRHVTAIAGAPGSGKSTLADRLAARLDAQEPGSAAVLPMDGYHYDDRILEARGWRARKGAPHTFDVDGFGHMLARLRAAGPQDVAVPVFDRGLEIARNAARIIPGTVRHLLVEGNYLLLDQAPWRDLATQFDTTVFLDVPMSVLRARLTERWRDLSAADRAEKLNANDLPNAQLVVSLVRTCDWVMRE